MFYPAFVCLSVCLTDCKQLPNLRRNFPQMYSFGQGKCHYILEVNRMWKFLKDSSTLQEAHVSGKTDRIVMKIFSYLWTRKSPVRTLDPDRIRFGGSLRSPGAAIVYYYTVSPKGCHSIHGRNFVNS